MAVPAVLAATLSQVALSSIKGLFSVFGVEMGADGININWRRVLFWSLLAPLIPLIGGRIVAVFRDCIEMFSVWSGNDSTFSMGILPSRFISWVLPNTGGDPSAVSNAVPIFIYYMFVSLGIDKLIGVTIQILAFRIFQKNSERFFAGLTAVIHTAVQSLHK